MNKKKKIITSIGTIGAAAIPVAVIVACGSASNEWKYNAEEKLFVDGLKLSEFQSAADKTKDMEKRSWQIANEQSAFYYYEQEQKASLKVQKDKFLWEIRQKEEKRDNLDSSISSNTEEINEINKEIDDIKDKITQLSNLNYDSSTFSNDFPEVLLTAEKIKEKQRDIYRNEKDDFVKNYPTKAEGQAEWVAKLASKYDGANTDEQAIENNTYKVIKNNAFLRNNIEINKNYTVKQLKWANGVLKDKNGVKINPGGAFPFLKIKGYDDNKTVSKNISVQTAANNDSFIRVTGDNDEDKVYFYSSKSNLWGHDANEENLKVLNKDRIDNITNGISDLRMYRHALLNIQPNKAGRTQPWTASIDLIKSLFEMTPGSNAHNHLNQFSRIADLWKDMDEVQDLVNKSAVSKESGFFLEQVSNNSDSTKTKGGSLGIHKASYWSNGMFNGFALGALTLEKNFTNNNNQTNIDNKDDDQIYSKLAKAIEEAKDEILGLNGNKQKFTSNQAQNEFIDTLSSERVKNIFGIHIRNLFDTYALNNTRSRGQIGRSLIYTDAGLLADSKDDRFAFVSTEDKGGIHLIKRYAIDSKDLGKLAMGELDKMSQKENTKVELDVIGLIKPLLDQSMLVKNLLTPTTNKSSPNKDYVSFKDFIQSKKDIKYDDLEAINNAQELLASAQKYIDTKGKIKAHETALAITNAHKDYLTKALNNKEIAYTPYDDQITKPGSRGISITSKEILTPEEIYSSAYEIAKKESGI